MSLFAFPQSSRAANFSVGDATSLIAAINTANSNGVADIITLTADIDLTAVHNTTNGPNGLPSITSNIEINGGFAITRNSGALGCGGVAPDFRILHVAASGNLTLNNVTLSGGCATTSGFPDGAGAGLLSLGTATVSNSTLSNNEATNGAGLTNFGTLVLSESTINGNRSIRNAGGLWNQSTATIINSTISNNRSEVVSIITDNGGGGIVNIGTMTLTSSVINGNIAISHGGGIFNFGTLNVNNSTITANRGNRNGGGITNAGGTTTVSNSTVSGNQADFGGGLYNLSSLTVSSTTVSGNTATASGGGLFNNSNTIVSNSTISGNTSTGNLVGFGGGGIWTGGSTTVTSSTISNNSSPGTNAVAGGINIGSVSSSIIANNTAGGGNANCRFLTDNGNNLSNNPAADGCTGFGTIVPGTDYNTALANNGGPTQTHALVSPGSVAINTGSCSLTADQRGAARDATCDVGAFENATIPTLPTIAFAAATTTFSETAGTVNITLNVSGAANFVGIAEVYIVNPFSGSATSVTDFSAVGVLTVTIDCSSGTCPTSVTVPLTILTDSVIDPNETVDLEIIATNGLAIIGAQSTQETTIQDVPPAVAPIAVGGVSSSGNIEIFDPAISKIGFLTPGQTGVTGEQLEWIVTVSNPSSVTGNNIVVTDTLINDLRIDRVEAPNATVNISGQTVSVSYTTLNSGESVQFSIFTTVLAGQQINNVACINADNLSTEECATGSIVRQLPSTGQSPFWRDLLVAFSGLALIAVMIQIRKSVISA